MPIYEYLCESCGRISEVMQKVADPSPKSCPECGSKKIAKLVSRSAFQLKGGGWYADLYSSKKREAGQGEAHEKSKDAAGEKSSPAAKPATDGEKPSPAAKPSADGKQKAQTKPAAE